MKSIFRHKKYKYLLSGITLSSICIAVLVLGFNKSSFKSAASAGYYNTYTTITGIEDSSSYTSTQGFSIDGSKAYYVKLNNSTGASRVWMYDIAKKKKYVVYNGNSSVASFDMGHANCIYANYKYIYVAAQKSNDASLYRYTINYKNGKYYLTDKRTFCVYSHNPNVKKPIAITGIEHSPELGGFLLKNGTDVYLGSFVNNQFQWRKHFTIDTNINVYTNNGPEYINGKNFTRQGMYYKNGTLYMPMTNSNAHYQSIIVAYSLNSNTPNNALLSEIPNKFIRVTSSTFGKLFEIENIACYNGQMYANVNATYTKGGNSDRIIKINNFYY